MSDNPFDHLPAEVVAQSEQSFADANSELDQLIEAMRADIAERENTFGHHSDSEHYMVECRRLFNRLMLLGPTVAPTYVSVMVSAMFRLARAPRAEIDPLEALFNSPDTQGDSKR